MNIQTYFIKRIVPVGTHEAVTTNEPIDVEIEGEKMTLLRPVTTMQAVTVDTMEDVETFEELPAPAVTLGGRLLALSNDTGFQHVAIQGLVITRNLEAVI